MKSRSTRHGGWFMVDALLSMAVIVIIAAALAASMAQQRKAEARLAASRDAIRLAENALIALHTGKTAPPPPAGTTMEVLNADSGRTPSGWKWVTLRVTRDGKTATLTGLVPAGGAQ